jgi:uncharacterized protein (TIGR00725 family)
MQEVADGARAKDTNCIRIGIHPGSSDADKAINCPIYTGLGDGRNYINAHASDVMIALYGGSGTLSEIAHAMKLKRPVVLFPAWHFLRALVKREKAKAAFVDTAKRAVQEAFKFLDGNELVGEYPDWPGQERQKEEFEHYVLRANNAG